ncbi:MAG TPA: sugar phosphate isomerase/epimerase [Mycobacteriales bacterium]|nr:sugar phosphate isomerase/epimerase [Mycobacteriales bacterium]
MTGPFWTMFTKPWPDLTVPQLADLAARIGVGGIELPVRPGFQVEPETAERTLPEAARIFADRGLVIADVASSAEERVLAACAEAGIPLVRIMLPIQGDDFLATADAARRLLDEMVPLCRRYQVAIGIQPHQDHFTSTGIDLWNLVRDYDPLIGAAWDAGHEGLAGQPVQHSLSALRDRLHMVNMKNATYRQTGESPARWKQYWTTADQGLCDWAKTIEVLVSLGYDKSLCLCAEYSHGDVEQLVVEDFAYGRELLARARA